MNCWVVFFLSMLTSHLCLSQNNAERCEKNSWQNKYKSLLADKAAEFSHIDVCHVVAYFRGEDESFCLKAENLILSKAAAKGLGAAVRASYLDESDYAVVAALAAGYCGSKFSETLSESSHGLISLLMFAAGVNVFSQKMQSKEIFSENTTRVDQKEAYMHFEEGFMNPLFFKILRIGSIIALEKRVENFLFSMTNRLGINAFFQANSGLFPSKKMSAFVKLATTGTSKVGSALLIFITSISVNLLIDQFFINSEKKGFSGMKKAGQDLITTFSTSVFQGFVVPVILILAPPSLVFVSQLISNRKQAF